MHDDEPDKALGVSGAADERLRVISGVSCRPVCGSCCKQATIKDATSGSPENVAAAVCLTRCGRGLGFK